MSHLNYLANRRKHHALSQRELGMLLGLTDSAVGKLENGVRKPKLRLVLDLEIVFGLSPCALFADYYAARTEVVLGRAAELERLLVGKEDSASRKKRALLAQIMARAISADRV